MACGYNDRTGACMCRTPRGEDRRLEIGEPIEQYKERQKEAGQRAAAVTKRKASVHAALPKTVPRKSTAAQRKGEILVFPGLISEDDCRHLGAYLDELVARENNTRRVVPDLDSPVHRVLGGAVQAVVPMEVKLLDYVSFGKEAAMVWPHYDEPYGNETHKILLFLDGVAGTRFWESREAYRGGECPVNVPGARGTVVIFPMPLYHDSMAFTSYDAPKGTLNLGMVLPSLEGADALGLTTATG